MSTIKIKQVKSAIKRPADQKATIKALGLLREPIQIAKTRNIKLSKVFNG